MSYSRWGSSCWYTFSDCQMINGEDTLNVNCDDRYPMSKLKAEKESVLEHYRQLRFGRNPANYQGEGPPPKDRYTEEEIQELSDIIDYFIHDHESGEMAFLRSLAIQANLETPQKKERK